MPKKRPVGRPKKKPGTNEITPMRYFRCTDQLWAEFESAAQIRGLTTSEWIRETLKRAARRRKD